MVWGDGAPFLCRVVNIRWLTRLTLCRSLLQDTVLNISIQPQNTISYIFHNIVTFPPSSCFVSMSQSSMTLHTSFVHFPPRKTPKIKFHLSLLIPSNSVRPALSLPLVHVVPPCTPHPFLSLPSPKPFNQPIPHNSLTTPLHPSLARLAPYPCHPYNPTSFHPTAYAIPQPKFPQHQPAPASSSPVRVL